jgi:hypothetical protein
MDVVFESDRGGEPAFRLHSIKGGLPDPTM